MTTNAEKQKRKRTKYLATGKCTTCGHKVGAAEKRKRLKSCRPCLKRLARQRQRARVQGNCLSCFKEAGDPLTCRPCQDRSNAKARIVQREEYRRSRAAGLCGARGCQKRSSKSFCERHMATIRASQQRKRDAS